MRGNKGLAARLRGSGGSTLVFVAIMMPALLALCGLVIDGGFLARQVMQLDAAADAAARAATDAYDRTIWQSERRVVIDETQAAQLAQTYLEQNMPSAVLVSVQLEPDTTNKIRVTAKATVHYAFMRIVGIRQSDITSWSVAMKQ